jgi:Icc-related predicted phosphoesterase
VKIVLISDDDLSVGTLDVEGIDLLVTLGNLWEQSILRCIESYRPAYVLGVRGNHDVEPLPEYVQDLHLKVAEIEGVKFGGFGGSWRYKDGGAELLYEQSQVTLRLENFPPVDVFLAHNSPRGVHERDDDVHQGFLAFRKYIQRAQPRCFFHGHQHLNETTMMGETRVVGVYGEVYLELEL